MTNIVTHAPPETSGQYQQVAAFNSIHYAVFTHVHTRIILFAALQDLTVMGLRIIQQREYGAD